MLVIDDDHAVRELIKNILETYGYGVTAVSNGEVGYWLVSNESFDLVITDILMAGIDGITLIDRIRLLGTRGRIPCLVVTGSGIKSKADEAMKAGADMVIQKPFDLRTLLGGVRELLGRPSVTVH